MKSVKIVRYGEASKDKVNVIWWENFDKSRHWISLPLEWYTKGGHPVDALRKFVPDFIVSAHTEFEHLERMYRVPTSGQCEGRFENG